MMKKIFLAGTMIFSALFADAQNWNPYVSQGIISPAPLLPLQLNGTGVASFNLGNSGDSPLTCNPDIPDNNLSIIITLSYGVPDVYPLDPANALTTIGGTWADKFAWQYNVLQNCFTGIQKQTIAGQSQGTITIQYKVSKNSTQAQPQNGLKVKLLSPAYTFNTNATNDDTVSCYTYTETRDSGDTPK